MLIARARATSCVSRCSISSQHLLKHLQYFGVKTITIMDTVGVVSER
jgi:hypothetical protein